LEWKFKKLFPRLPLTVEYFWTGTFGKTKDGLPYIGTPFRMPHVHFALGYGGNGITYSLTVAEIIRDDFFGRKNPAA
jgi:glycine/D-amino acid oxidase-like deaminating enzyme